MNLKQAWSSNNNCRLAFDDVESVSSVNCCDVTIEADVHQLPHSDVFLASPRQPESDSFREQMNFDKGQSLDQV